MRIKSYTDSPLKYGYLIPECQNEVKRNFGRISKSFQCPKLSVRDSFAPDAGVSIG